MNNLDRNRNLARLNATPKADRPWEIMLMTMEGMSPDLVSALWAVAVPHWYNPEVLAALRPELADKDEYPFVEEYPHRGQNLQELTRELLLSKMPPDQLRLLSDQAAWYFFDPLNA